MRLITILGVLTSICAFSQAPDQDLFDEINNLRRKRNLPVLEYDTAYQGACGSWAKYISKHFGHSFYNRKDLGEAISIDLPRQDIVKDFMNSKPHKKTLMNRVAKRICIATYQPDPDGPIYTCIRTYR